jgi:hypothetical protein
MKIFGVLLAVCLLGACAVTQVDPSQMPEEKSYVTGSNIPKKDRSGVQTMSKEQAEAMIRQSAPVTAGSRQP